MIIDENDPQHPAYPLQESVIEERLPSRQRRPTSSGLLLTAAREELGLRTIAIATGIPLDRLEEAAAGEQRLTLEEQARLADAVAQRVPPRTPLHRRARALRGQVRAAFDFEAGTTTRHANAEAPRTPWR